MGYDIIGISQAKRVAGRHSDEVCDAEEHYTVGSNRKRLEGHKPGCYVANGKTHDFYANYGGYDTWLNNLSAIILGASVDDVVSRPRRFKGKPFVELIKLPFGNDVGIGPVTSVKLYQDFVDHALRVKRGFQRIAQEAQQRPTKKKRATKNEGLKVAQQLAKAIGGLVVGGEDDPASSAWEWKWELYRDFRKAFKLASDNGFVILSP